MDELARLPPSDRAAVFTVAADEQGLPTHIIEKDFWVCWILKRLFDPDLVPGMVFKGGTSLSKGWNAIARFSEDVDLTIPRKGLPGTAAIDPLEPTSRTQRGKKLDELKAELASWCAGAGRAELEGRIGVEIGTSDDWRVEVGGVDQDTIWVHYPAAAQGRLRMVPSESCMSALSADYRMMKEMYYETPLSFEVVLDRMREIEVAVLKAMA